MLSQRAVEVKLPDRVRAAQLLEATGTVRILPTFAKRKDGRSSYEGRAVISSTDRQTFEWLRATWGGWVLRPLPHRPESWSWLAKGHREAGDFLRSVYQFTSLQKPWIETTLEFLEFQQQLVDTHGKRPMPIEAYLRQVSMYERQQALRSLRSGIASLRVLPGLLV